MFLLALKLLNLYTVFCQHLTLCVCCEHTPSPSSWLLSMMSSYSGHFSLKFSRHLASSPYSSPPYPMSCKILWKQPLLLAYRSFRMCISCQQHGSLLPSISQCVDCFFRWKVQNSSSNCLNPAFFQDLK